LIFFSTNSIIVLSIDAIDVSGEQHINIEHNIYKRRLNLKGEPIEKPEKETCESSDYRLIITSNAFRYQNKINIISII
jgi:hypothetical protein